MTNTPWGERHAYVIDGREGVFDKALHVSPFMPMEQRYSWRATTPDDTLKVHIASSDEDGRPRVRRHAVAAPAAAPPSRRWPVSPAFAPSP